MSSSVSGAGIFLRGRWYSFLYMSGHVCVFIASLEIVATGVANSGRNSLRITDGISPVLNWFSLIPSCSHVFCVLVYLGAHKYLF